MATTTVLPSRSYPSGTHTWTGTLPAGVTAATVEITIPAQAAGPVGQAWLYDSPDGGVTWNERGAAVGGGPGGCDSIFAFANLQPNVKVVATVTGGSLTVGVTVTF